ncbi:TIGR02391 family protein [Candidatus Poriferisocius sp.]|uniref:TIGR02391 family protein n=1 Tax=Candidatus Poriferisocius sp. TaxID=3101276 RepID=UPI003B5AA501
MAGAESNSTGVRALQWARALEAELRWLGLGRDAGQDSSGNQESTFDEVVDDDDLIAISRDLFLHGHYSSAVLEAYKCLNNFVKGKSAVADKDGAKLMNHVFSAKDPVLAVNELSSRSERDEQTGYMQIFAGAMTGIRNPRAHEHGYEDDPASALELLGLANHLMRVARRATAPG